MKIQEESNGEDSVRKLHNWNFLKVLPDVAQCLRSGEHFQVLGCQKFGKTSFVKDLLESEGFERKLAKEDSAEDLFQFTRGPELQNRGYADNS